ncbi:MAG: putative membrane protein [Parvicellaceae bacterium]|jgi:uncharacterized membrane protein
MRIKVLLVALCSISSLFLNAQEIKQYTVEEYNALSGEIKDGLETISPTSHLKNYFADEQDGFLIQFAQFDLVNSFDSLVLNVDSLSLPLNSLNPIVITGFKEGDHTIEFKAKSQIPFAGDSKIKIILGDTRPLFENDAIVFGLLLAILALIFWTGKIKRFNKFYAIVPALLLCYFIPAILNSFDIINSNVSELYGMAKNFLLPAALVMLCISIDLKAVFRLGPKALIMFFTATFGILVGGPIALWICTMIFPDILSVQGKDVADGLSTVAGSWIGGGANQAAMKEINDVGDLIYSQMIIVDVFIANIFMSVILFGIGKRKRIDKWLKADNTAIDKLQQKMQDYSSSVSKIPTFKDVMVMMGVVFAVIGLAHVMSEFLAPALNGMVQGNPFFSFLGNGFFWIVVLATVFGVLLSFTKAKKMEGVGASRIGSLFIYILVATIGMKMDIEQLIANWATFKVLITVGLIWISIHAIILIVVAKLIKAPYFFAAVGSQANIGGAASAPVVAGAFHPSLAPVGVLLAVLGYAVGTVVALLCAGMLQMAV